MGQHLLAHAMHSANQLPSLSHLWYSQNNFRLRTAVHVSELDVGPYISEFAPLMEVLHTLRC